MTGNENDPLRSLEREAEPPAFLKARVMRTLRGQGVLRRAGSGWRVTGGIAAALVLFAAGLVAGRARGTAPAAVDARASYVLLLYEDSAFRRDRPEQEFVEEYSAWAGDLARRGALVSGEKLDSTAHLLREDTRGVHVDPADARSDLGQLAGFFIIKAASQDEALQIAQSCPHLGHGGRIALRPIVPT